jgi:hypothetical protein
MRRFIRVSVFGLLLFFLLYKYVYLQLGLIKAHEGPLLALLGTFAVISFVLAGSETAITKISDGELTTWHAEVSEVHTKIVEALKNPIFDEIKVIRKLADRIYRFLHFSRTDLFIREQDGVPVVDIDGCVSMIVTCNAIINLNIAVLLPLCLLNTSVFVDSMPSLPLIGYALRLEPRLLLPGSAGFTSVGVTIILLLAVELIPKKLALSNPIAFFGWSSFLIVLLQKLWLPSAFAETLDGVAIGLIYLGGCLWTLIRHPCNSIRRPR